MSTDVRLWYNEEAQTWQASVKLTDQTEITASSSTADGVLGQLSGSVASHAAGIRPAFGLHPVIPPS